MFSRWGFGLNRPKSSSNWLHDACLKIKKLCQYALYEAHQIIGLILLFFSSSPLLSFLPCRLFQLFAISSFSKKSHNFIMSFLTPHRGTWQRATEILATRLRPYSRSGTSNAGSG
jgi:hypothetical protein